MKLEGLVQPARNGAIGFDTDWIVSKETAAAFFSEGWLFCIRYLSLQDCIDPGDLTSEEASDILAGGLALMPVQHVRNTGWQPTAALGTEDGGNAANQAAAIGFLSGVNLWCDVEGVACTATADNVSEYCRAWYTAVCAAGYVPGLYVGANCILDGSELYALPFQHYWQSLSRVPALPHRGYQMVQTDVAAPMHGIGIDQDTVLVDNEGGLPIWLAPSAANQ